MAVFRSCNLIAHKCREVISLSTPSIFLRSLSAAADRLPLSRTGSSGRHMESLHESGWRKNSRTQASPRPCTLNCFRPSGAERQYQPCTASYALETVAPQEVFRSSFGGYAVKSNTKGRLYIAPPPRLGTHCKQPACLPSVPYKPPVSITRHGALCLLSTSGQIFRDRHQHRRPPVAPHAAMCGKRGLVTCCVRGRTRNVRFSKGHPPCRRSGRLFPRALTEAPRAPMFDEIQTPNKEAGCSSHWI